MGGTAPAGRITVPISAFDTSALGGLGGDETLPSHGHDGSSLTGASGGSHTHTHADTHQHNNTYNGYSASAADANNAFVNNAAGIPDAPVNTYAQGAYIAFDIATGVTVDALSGVHTHALTGTFDVNSNTSGIANGSVQPTIILSKIIKT
jgi:hypothetical protein